MKKIAFVFSFLMIAFTTWQCGVTNKVINATLPSIEADRELGAKTAAEIAANPKQFPILDEGSNQQIYSYVRGMTSKILNSGKIRYRNAFAWQVKIIKDDKTLNAFCTPGGYIYVYTGLIKYLDSEDQLAGVMGHEIAHADCRHSMRQLYKQYGVQLLLSVGMGATGTNPNSGAGQIAQITSSLVGLKFSREDETEADACSVKYLCPTEYNAAGAAGFFRKVGNGNSPPEFMSTHPNPDNRVQNIENNAKASGCRGTAKNESEYSRMKASIR